MTDTRGSTHPPRWYENKRKATDQQGDCTRCQTTVNAILLTPAGGNESLCRNCVSDIRQLEIARTTQNNELLDALRGMLENTGGWEARMEKREIAQAAVDKATQ